jgi:uncharacterized protein YkwD
MILRTHILTRRAIALVAAIAVVGAVGVTAGSATSSANHYLGSISSVALNRPVVGMAATPAGGGYWLAAADGGVFTFGNAKYHGSSSKHSLRAPIVGIASTRSGKGYWLVAADGGVFSFGDARFHGSAGRRRLVAPIVGITRTRSGHGYWLAAADGGVFSFGDAQFHGSAGRRALTSPVVAIASTRGGHGYWLAARNGGVFSFGDARYQGSARGTIGSGHITGITAMASGAGYWLVARNGATYAFGHAHDYATQFPSGSTALSGRGNTAVAIVASTPGGYWVASRRGTVGVSSLRRTPAVKVTAAAPAAGGPVNKPRVTLQLLIRMNAERKARHLAPFAWDGLLARRADAWARSLLIANGFKHQNLGSIANAAKGRFAEVGENLFSGTGGAADAGTAHLALMNSTEHRMNLLLPQGQLVGISAMCLQGKLMVVEDFAIRMGSRLPPPSQGIPALDPIISTNEGGAGC